jgi:DNA polymerase-3 subunit delta'
MTGETDLPEPDAAPGAPHPRHAAQLFGQARAEAAFLSAVRSGRLHHAWLIAGPKGVGKATLAWRLARFLLTVTDLEAADTLDPAAGHPALPRIAALAEPRLKLIRRGHDLSGREPRLRTRITVDEVRALAGFFGLSAADGGRRVVIVDAADDMTPNAANAVLKLLEEPPQGAVLLLVAHQPSRLLPTIRSRCRVLPCAPLDAAGLAAALDQAGCGDGAAPDALAALAGGSAGRAVALAMEGGAEAYASLVTLMSGAPGLDRAALAELAAACAGREAQPRFDLTLDLIDLLLHRLARTGAAGRPAPEAAPGEAAMLARLSPGLRAARVWAETTAATERARRGAAVNLDPAGLILDTGLALDRAAGRAAAP